MRAVESSARAARHVRKLSGNDLVEAAEQLEQTMQTPGWTRLVALLNEEFESVDRKLDGAKPLGHVDYAMLHGQRRGLKAVGEVVSTVLTKRDAWLSEQQAKHGGAPSAPDRS